MNKDNIMKNIFKHSLALLLITLMGTIIMGVVFVGSRKTMNTEAKNTKAVVTVKKKIDIKERLSNDLPVVKFGGQPFYDAFYIMQTGKINNGEVTKSYRLTYSLRTTELVKAIEDFPGKSRLESAFQEGGRPYRIESFNLIFKDKNGNKVDIPKSEYGAHNHLDSENFQDLDVLLPEKIINSDIKSITVMMDIKPEKGWYSVSSIGRTNKLALLGMVILGALTVLLIFVFIRSRRNKSK